MTTTYNLGYEGEKESIIYILSICSTFFLLFFIFISFFIFLDHMVWFGLVWFLYLMAYKYHGLFNSKCIPVEQQVYYLIPCREWD